MRGQLLLILIVFVAFRCTSDRTEKHATQPPPQETLFRFLPGSETGVNFFNNLQEGPNTNILMYEYFYNGGGVAAGDLNNDGLIDLYFTSNMDANKLYLNKGKLKFAEVTRQSGATGRTGPWKTGVTMADVNGDGRLDLYVCYSGTVREENRTNQLFINEGNDNLGIPHFTERAAEYGLASAGYSNQIYFLDYDRDSDLDAILLNHNPESLPVLNEVSTAARLKVDDPLKGVRVYKNNNGRFTDVTTKVGVNGSELTYGLGVAISDYNNDGWPDFYLSNDYAVPDYLYINNKNGTFTNTILESMGHISQFSMGNDAADINNDGWTDIITLDMLPEDNRRQKQLMAGDNYEKFQLNLRTGFHHQYMRNMLQLNNGNGTYSEVGQFAGISNTDWSWSALLADYDNDGHRDLFITNGYLRDFTNLDFIKYMDNVVKARGRLKREDVLDIISHMPSSNVVNYLFSGSDSLKFTDQTKAWGIHKASNSNGAAYADLDNDGDLDLITNNVNQEAFILENRTERDSTKHFVSIKLKGEGKNSVGLGAKIRVSTHAQQQYFEQWNTRGFVSSVSPVINVGLGKATIVDTLVITWPSGKQQELTGINADRMIEVSESDAQLPKPGIKSRSADKHETLFTSVNTNINQTYVPKRINDFKRQVLLLDQPSYFGPCMIKGDLNGDGLEDIYAGGHGPVKPQVYIQTRTGQFTLKAQPALASENDYDDADAVIFDANGDGHNDLYVAHGGYGSLEPEDKKFQDRLYLNDGSGRFTTSGSLPELLASKGCVAAGDLNGDTYPDLFVGGRIVPGRYPEIPSSFVLINDGKGDFKDATESLAPELQKAGMVTTAVIADLNRDGKNELAIAGEWLPITIFQYEHQKLVDATLKFFDHKNRGWWNKIIVADLNSDSIPDIVAGNAGTNNQLHATDDQPVEMYAADFDKNGSIDPLFTYYIQNKSFPFVTRDELLEQLAPMRKKFTTYDNYADATLDNIITEADKNQALHLSANEMKTLVFFGNRDGKFTKGKLPDEAQFAPVYAIAVGDFDGDRNQDLLLCGNDLHTKIRIGNADANYGQVFVGDGNGNFRYVDQRSSGLSIKGEVRSILQIKDLILIGASEQRIQTFKVVR
ncbi:VCBS repeat-containing protein [Chryseolinea sp. T2]|uniref:VCBS repeat-containing protein n=1 Tax=Chryseolinea sp. T2 TaxID=3129255 RepID=UPI0030773197